MTNTSRNKEIININNEILAYLKANTSVIEDLIKQMIHQSSETKDFLLKVDTFLEHSNEVKNSIEMFQEEIKTLNNNFIALISANNSLILEEDKNNLSMSIKHLINFLEKANFMKKEIQTKQDETSTLFFQQFLQLQQQQQQQIINLQQQILQQNNLTLSLKEVIDSSILKLFQQFSHEGHCNCMINNKIFHALKDNIAAMKEETSSKNKGQENNNYSFSDVIIFEVSCFILGIALYLIIIDLF
uniref:Transmembrane protein n=1 Tax=Strongyloides venezuelensis TaxID=75913 RepID=A0A0K0F3S7_STRVS